MPDDERAIGGVMARFLRAGRAVLLHPAALERHECRVDAALALTGAEPLQAALVDLLSALPPVDTTLRGWLSNSSVCARLAPHVVRGLLAHAADRQPLPLVNAFATRWCVIAIPSRGVNARALLSSVDDSRSVVAEAMAQMAAGNVDAEADFLAHCLGTRDSVAFMLMYTRLRRAGTLLAPDWERVLNYFQERKRYGKHVDSGIGGT